MQKISNLADSLIKDCRDAMHRVSRMQGKHHAFNYSLNVLVHLINKHYTDVRFTRQGITTCRLSISFICPAGDAMHRVSTTDLLLNLPFNILDSF